jgi:membrane fusion protein (multidrug efflux system)
VQITDQLPGRTTAFRVAEVRPQVTGIVQKRLFAEGSEVKAVQQLFQIDSGSYRAALSSAEAALKRAEAQAVTAKLLAERYEPLIAANAVSKQENDEAIAARARAEADVASARAAVDAARINLVYTQVLSPINGRIGRTLVTEGALVTSGQQGAARHRAAARSDLRRHRAVEHRDAAAAAPARERRARQGCQQPGRGARSRSRMAASIASTAG